MFRLLFLLATLLVTGCAGVTDVSNDKRVRGYVGYTVGLHRPMLLVKRSGYFFGGPNDVMVRRHVRYGLVEPGIFRAPHVFAHLPIGHRVSIDALQEEVYFGAWETVVYGHTTFPPTGKEISFACVRPPLKYMHPVPGIEQRYWPLQSFPWEE